MRRALCAALVWLVGCTPSVRVLRVEDDAYVVRTAYEPAAYLNTMAAVLAEQDGKLVAAAYYYGAALEHARDDPELATRVYSASCRARPVGGFDEPRARRRWLAGPMEAGYGPAFAAVLTCLQRHGDDPPVRRAAEAGLLRYGREPLEAVRVVEGESADALALRLMALTLRYPELAEAHRALAACLEQQGKLAAAAESYAHAARRAPSSRVEMMKKAEALAMRGERYGAMRVAGAAMDAPVLEGAPLGALPEEAVGLAVDEALARDDERATLRRATRGRMALGEVAARAMTWGRRELALQIAESVVRAADAADADAAAVLLVAGVALPARVDGVVGAAGRALLERATAHAK